MSEILGIALLLASFSLISYFRLHRSLGSVIFLTVLFGLMGLELVTWSAIIILPASLVAVTFINFGWLRAKLISSRLLSWFRKVLPPVSPTEQAAIDAGDTWWEAELFQGKPNWEKLLSLPNYALTQVEKDFLNNQVETLCSMLDDWQIVHEQADLPQEVWNYLKQEKFFSMIIPKKYGGLEFSAKANSAVVNKIATKSISCAVTVMVPNSLGPAELLLAYGTKDQKNYYLPRLADGTEIPCFGLTSKDAGSDAGAISDTGIICYQEVDGQKTLGIKLNFSKRYITLAPKATLIGLAFKLMDPEHLVGQKKEIGITLALISSSHPGVTTGARHLPLNAAFLNGPIQGKNVFIPLDAVIGGQQMLGQGWKMLIECLAQGRGISLPALSAATGHMCYRTTGAYAALRRQFNLPISRFEGVGEKLAKIGGLTYILESLRQFTTIGIDQNIKPAIATAITKYHATEMSREIVNAAMDVHGGKGIMLGPKNYLGRAYQSTPISITVEGANILTRSLMIFGQGAIRCHPYVLQEIQSAHAHQHDPKTALKSFDKALISHVGFTMQNFMRTIWHGISQGSFSKIKLDSKYGLDNAKHVKSAMQKLNWLSASLSLTADVTMLTLGGKLKLKESLSARLGDALSYMYLASALIKHYQTRMCMPHNLRDDAHKAEQDYFEWAMQYCLYNIQVALIDFYANFPNKIIGTVLKRLAFPWGMVIAKPTDKQGSKLIKSMVTSNKFRSYLTELCFSHDNIEDPVGIYDIALSMQEQIQPIINKLNAAVKSELLTKSMAIEQKLEQALQHKIINKQEFDFMLDYQKICDLIINVDDFSKDYALGTKELWTKQSTKEEGQIG